MIKKTGLIFPFLLKKIFFISVFFSIVLFISCQKDRVDYFPTEEWRTASPESQGIDSQELFNVMKPLVTNDAANLHSLLIIRNGYIIAEYYSPLHNEKTLHNLHSATKSFTSTLVGMAVDQKKLNLDDKVLSFFPDYHFENMSEYKEAMTVRDLLVMGSGLDWGEMSMAAPGEDNVLASLVNAEDWCGYILDRKVITKPGFLFNYNSGNSHLLTTIISKTVGQPVNDFAKENLFGPLGISDYIWTEDPAGVPAGGIGLQLAPRDMAKLGLLYLNNGVWDGKRLLSKKWIKESTENYYSDSEGNISYGYQFWINPFGFSAVGHGFQEIIVIPRENTILVTTGSFDYARYEAGNRAWGNFHNGIWNLSRSKKPLPENQEAYSSLISDLKSLSEEKTEKAEVPSSLETLIGKKILLNKNQAHLSAFRIMTIEDNKIEVEISAVDPTDGKEKTAVFQTGTNHLYFDNGYRGYPLSVSFHFKSIEKGHYPDTTKLSLFIRASFPDENTLVLDSIIPGSVVQSRIILKTDAEEPLLIWKNIGITGDIKIRGTIE